MGKLASLLSRVGLNGFLLGIFLAIGLAALGPELGSQQSSFPWKPFIQVGIAEANMIGLAAGLAIGGKIPFAGTFANFATGRVYDQIRQSLAYSHKNEKICNYSLAWKVID